MNIFNMIGRWWGLAVATITIITAGLVGMFTDNVIISNMFGFAIGMCGAFVMLCIGDKYE
jgi:hypothetical protein